MLISVSEKTKQESKIFVLATHYITTFALFILQVSCLQSSHFLDPQIHTMTCKIISLFYNSFVFFIKSIVPGVQSFSLNRSSRVSNPFLFFRRKRLFTSSRISFQFQLINCVSLSWNCCCANKRLLIRRVLFLVWSCEETCSRSSRLISWLCMCVVVATQCVL